MLKLSVDLHCHNAYFSEYEQIPGGYVLNTLTITNKNDPNIIS